MFFAQIPHLALLGLLGPDNERRCDEAESPEPRHFAVSVEDMESAGGADAPPPGLGKYFLRRELQRRI